MSTNPNPTPPRRPRPGPRERHATGRRRDVVHAALVGLALVALVGYLWLLPFVLGYLFASAAPRAATTAAPTVTRAVEGPLTAAFATTAETATVPARETAPAPTTPATVPATASVTPVAVTRTIRAADEYDCGSRVRAGLVDLCLDLDPDPRPGAYGVNDRDKDREKDRDRDGRRCVCDDRDRDGDVYYYPAPRDEDQRRPGGWPNYRPGDPSNPGPYAYPGGPNSSGPQVCRFYQPGEHRDLPDGGAICTRATR